MLKLADAIVGYRGKALLSCIDLQISRGETIFLSGPNGSGKSSLAKSVLGVLPLISGKRENTFARLAYVPQSSNYEVQYPLTVTDLVMQGFSFTRLFDYRIKNSSVKHIRQTKLADVLKLVNLASAAKLLLRELSGGQLQRALIARALIGEPDFLLLDEPFSNLDRQGRKGVAEILKHYVSDKNSLCVIDHGDALEHSFYSRVLEIDAGHLMTVASGKI